MKKISIKSNGLKKVRVNEDYLVSYNVEMTEVTGGTFWKAYSEEQISGEEAFEPAKDFSEMGKLMQMYDPIDLSNKRLVELTKALGPAHVRVSGSWASHTYYDFDGKTSGVPPKGFQAVLTKEQWNAVLEFIKNVNGKLQISVANTDGVHDENGVWKEDQAKLIFDYSKNYGVPIFSTEFMNEPNTYLLGGAPQPYSNEELARDQDLYYRFIRKNYPETLLVGPGVAGDKEVMEGLSITYTNNIPIVPTRSIIELCKEKPDIFSYHYYNGISERGAMVIGGHWDVKDALSEEYLSVAGKACEFYGTIRDEFVPGAPMWVTESGDAGCGGNTWGSTFLDVFRYANELGHFSLLTEGVIVHNTLTSSDYGLLDHKDHSPRPNYWLVLLWNQLVGSTVYDSEIEISEGAHVFAHSRKDGEKGYTYILINNSETSSTMVDIPANSVRYTLSAEELRSKEMMLNGKVLDLVGEYGLPELQGVLESPGALELKPLTVTFIVVSE
jgi:hypothetical protein